MFRHARGRSGVFSIIIRCQNTVVLPCFTDTQPTNYSKYVGVFGTKEGQGTPKHIIKLSSLVFVFLFPLCKIHKALYSFLKGNYIAPA